MTVDSDTELESNKDDFYPSTTNDEPLTDPNPGSKKDREPSEDHDHEGLIEPELTKSGHGDKHNDSLSVSVPLDYQMLLDFRMNNALVSSIVKGVSSRNVKDQIQACLKLIMAPNPRIPVPCLMYSYLDPVMEEGIIPKILTFLENEECPQLQEAAAWVVASMARLEAKALIDRGALDKLLDLLDPQFGPGLCQPVAYALSALAATVVGKDKRLFVKDLLDAGVVPALIKTMDYYLQEQPLNIQVLIALTRLAKMVSYVPKNKRMTKSRLKLMPILCETFNLMDENEYDVICNCAWSLNYLTKSGDEEIIDEVIRERGIIAKLVHLIGSLLDKDNMNMGLKGGLLKPCLNLSGNIISSTTDSHTDAILDAGLLPHLGSLILESKWSAEVNWIISNIAAGNVGQKEMLFQQGFFELILQVLQTQTGSGCKEAVFTILNIMDKGTRDQKDFLINNGVLSLLAKVLEELEDDVLFPVADATFMYTGFTYRNQSQGDQSLQKSLNESGILLELSKYYDDEIYADVFDRITFVLDVGLNNHI